MRGSRVVLDLCKRAGGIIPAHAGLTLEDAMNFAYS